MLNLNPASLISGASGRTAPFRIVTIADANYTPCDLAVKVTALPSQGVVLKADGITQVVLGQTVRDAELAALKFRPAVAATQPDVESTLKPKLEIWFVLSVPQNGEPRLMDIPAPGQSVEPYVEITELPSNGTVRLADGSSTVLRQRLSFAELTGLTFEPAADACGKISILQYRTGGPAEAAVTGGVLVVVGPDAPPMDMATEAPAADSNINTVAPLVTALLLDALSATNTTAMAAPADPNGAPPPEAATRNTQASLTDGPTPAQITTSQHSLSAQAVDTDQGDVTNSVANSPANDDPPPRIGSSTPPLASTPSLTSVLQEGTDLAVPAVPGVTSIAPPVVKFDTLPAGGAGLLSPIIAPLGVGGTSAATLLITDSQTAPVSGGAASEISSPGPTNGVVPSNPVVNSPESLFNSGAVPSIVTVNDHNAVELGVRFTASAGGVISGLLFYKGPENTGPHVADLWSSTGTLLATATFSNETASGWQLVNFASPVSITAGTTYIASYHTNGSYSADNGYFATPVASGNLTAPSDGNGVYAYGAAGSFPTNTYNASNYWVDVVYTKSALSPVANSDSGFTVNENGSITISAATLLANDTDPSGLPLTVTGVSNPTNGVVSFDANAKTVTFTPNAGYSGSASFGYTVADSSGETAAGTVALSVHDTGTTVSLFSPTSAPAITSANDPNSVELGFKFQTTIAGEITGLRFYKAAENTGPHVANLWSANGTLLDSATFTNETATGWQQVDFTNPVAVAAGTTYTASYHTSGYYSADPNLFATAQTNGPLTAPASSSSGGNGVYAYGSSSLFPTNSFNSTSYGVDVLFKAQLAA
jgi:hypothetical protein